MDLDGETQKKYTDALKGRAEKEKQKRRQSIIE